MMYQTSILFHKKIKKIKKTSVLFHNGREIKRNVKGKVLLFYFYYYYFFSVQDTKHKASNIRIFSTVDWIKLHTIHGQELVKKKKKSSYIFNVMVIT